MRITRTDKPQITGDEGGNLRARNAPSRRSRTKGQAAALPEAHRLPFAIRGLAAANPPMATLLERILRQFCLPPTSIHGPEHWERVYRIGRRIAISTGADITVVYLFAVFHDACRLFDGHDPDHGRRGARLATTFLASDNLINHDQLRLLDAACAGHADGDVTDEITIGTCWDADRLDLGRVGYTIDRRYLSTVAARRPTTTRWAGSLYRPHRHYQ